MECHGVSELLSRSVYSRVYSCGMFPLVGYTQSSWDAHTPRVVSPVPAMLNRNSPGRHIENLYRAICIKTCVHKRTYVYDVGGYIGEERLKFLAPTSGSSDWFFSFPRSRTPSLFLAETFSPSGHARLYISTLESHLLSFRTISHI